MRGVISFLTNFISFAEKIPVFTIDETQELVRFFNNQNRTKDYWPEEPLQRWELKKIQPKEYEKIDPHDSWFPISFDAKGNICSGEISQQYTYASDYPVLQKATKTAVELFAKKMHWENQTHLMGMSLVQHQMRREKEYSMHFHQDESRYTMVILLNDEKNWTGGDLRFRSLWCKWVQQTIHHQQGYGILFTNEGKQHSVTEMRSHSSGVTDRTILTIHEKCCTTSETPQQSIISTIKTLLANFLQQIRLRALSQY